MTTVTATVTVLALAGGTAVALPGGGNAKGAGTARTEPGPTGGKERRVTLITGDTATVDARGKLVRFVPAKGREHIPVMVDRSGGRGYVIPQDAHQLIASGRVDKGLFDITTLARAEYRERDGSSLRLIVGYGTGAGKARAQARTALRDGLRGKGGARIRHSYPTLDAEALTVPAASAGRLWKTLTRSAEGSSARTAAPGLDRVWLDRVRRASLDTTVRQIGAPAAWAKGYDGTGARIAVLDTGVDATHPELRGQEVAERNFSESADSKDRHGHGTHVASVAAGSGAGASGAYKGVAPGARLLDGKVLDDRGYGSDSSVLAGMEWAVAEKADIVNLSLGGEDAPFLDPLEAAVNRLSAAHGTLFVAAAGNNGPGAGTVNSPASADAALAVGAVDDHDTLARFSSRGPRSEGGTIKPDLTAPGVKVTAASAPGSLIAGREGENPPGYVTISGTSMATPHVAGAAALLKQRHPGWTHAELRSALAGSARPGGAGAFAEGTGRLDAAAALDRTVLAPPSSVGFAKQEYPHGDDRPETREITYRNTGASPVTLDLAVSGTGPDGEPAPEGMFTLAADRVTIPAGGTATAGLTSDTRPGGAVNGHYTAAVTATGGGQSVRTLASVEREVETYDVTFRHLNRDGEPTDKHWSDVRPVTAAGGVVRVRENGDTLTARLRKGTYFLHTWIDAFSEVAGSELFLPHLEVTGDTTVVLDARAAKPVEVTVPEPTAERAFAQIFTELDNDGFGGSFAWSRRNYSTMFTGHIGPDYQSGGQLLQQFNSIDVKDRDEYRIALGGPGTRLATGLQQTVARADLAEVRLRLGASVPGRRAALLTEAVYPGSFGPWPSGIIRPVPERVRLFLSARDVAWRISQTQYDATGENAELDNWDRQRTFRPGRVYREDLGIGVFGPSLRPVDGVMYEGLFRTGDTVRGCLHPLLDNSGTLSGAESDQRTATLRRDGVELANGTQLMDCWTETPVPAGRATFELTTTSTRSQVASVSTEVTTEWTVTSDTTAAETALPVSVVRFTPKLAADSTARAGAPLRVPVRVEGAAAGKNLRSLTVYVSQDGGTTWTKAKVVKGAVTVRNPERGSVSLRAVAVDRQGNQVRQTIEDAYRVK
ncbi:S8 family serine peptidase [Streptomyces sp. NPDC057638]|uniref:S8 family peptidase n=1 Tax=Streptomyces sp. NPDC057638 TaxID=3346190 RepID=UPI0036BEC488